MNDLSRFYKAQGHDYERALSEIRNGRKESHWMWYIFPQIEGLGSSRMACYYAIKDQQEASDYFHDPVLGKRLVEISEVLLKLTSDDAGKVMGWPDNLKLCSSMTLFSVVAPECEIFQKVLDKFYGGKPDRQTLEILKQKGSIR